MGRGAWSADTNGGGTSRKRQGGNRTKLDSSPPREMGARCVVSAVRCGVVWCSVM